MILPCRIHRIRSHIDSLPLALLFAASLLSPTRFGSMGQSAPVAAGYVPLEITSGVDFGYDDHVIGSNRCRKFKQPKAHFSQKKTLC